MPAGIAEEPLALLEYGGGSVDTGSALAGCVYVMDS